MNILSLTIDLPRAAYTITDKPSLTEQIFDALLTIFSLALLTFAAGGWGVIYVAGAVGHGLEWLIQTTRHLTSSIVRLFNRIDGWIIAILMALVARLLGKEEGLCFAA